MIGTPKEFAETVIIKETLWWNIWGNQILSWSRDRYIGYLSINCSCWSTLNSILRIPIKNIIHEIFGHEVPYHFQNAIKCLFFLASIIKIIHIEQTYLHMLSHELRKLEWIWYIFQYSIFGLFISEYH